MNPAREIAIFNNLTRKKEQLQPIEEGHVRMYACGTTPYDDNHIGHAMQAVFFDVIRNFLEYMGYRVTYVRNFTDVDDKIIARASMLGISPKALVDGMIAKNTQEMAQLSIRPASYEPRVSQTIPEIIAMVEELLAKGAAYVTPGGEVYYRVRQKSDYGKLSNRDPDDLRSGTRDIHQGDKEDPLDFALWKPDSTEDASWPSPWGQGRPGWHIECSAMAKKHLGPTFDIHGGGRDLMFPHHENEIAQSESANGVKFAQIWIHSGLLTVGNQKMSKSLGNTVTIEAFLQKWPAEVLRVAYLQNHYASNIDFSEKVFAECCQKLLYFYETMEMLRTGAVGKVELDIESYRTRFQAAMCEDFNTPQVMALLHQLARAVNQSPLSASSRAAALVLLQEIGSVLQVFQQEPAKFLYELKKKWIGDQGISEADILVQLEARKQARQERNWQQADAVRDVLHTMGIGVQDTPTGTTWTVRMRHGDDPV